MSKAKFYVVWKGRKTGVFNSWEDCAAQVNSFTGAEYKAFESRAAAEEAFKGAYSDYKGRYVSSLSAESLRKIGHPVMESVCVDAACSGNPGILEYHGVDTRTKRELFRQGPFENGTNNVGEFLAIVHALAVLQKKGLQDLVYSDSETAILWVKKKKCKTKLKPSENNRQIFDLIARAEDWLATNKYENPVLKWDTEAWGEIPADYGRK